MHMNLSTRILSTLAAATVAFTGVVVTADTADAARKTVARKAAVKKPVARTVTTLATTDCSTTLPGLVFVAKETYPDYKVRTGVERWVNYHGPYVFLNTADGGTITRCVYLRA